MSDRHAAARGRAGFNELQDVPLGDTACDAAAGDGRELDAMLGRDLPYEGGGFRPQPLLEGADRGHWRHRGGGCGRGMRGGHRAAVIFHSGGGPRAAGVGAPLDAAEPELPLRRDHRALFRLDPGNDRRTGTVCPSVTITSAALRRRRRNLGVHLSVEISKIGSSRLTSSPTS